MNQRVRKLREESVSTVPFISSERAELLTDFYQSAEARRYSVPVTRAKAFAYILEHRTISIADGELIVGERGPAPKATPTYPELCCHSLADLDIMNRRERTRFQVPDEVRKVYRDRIIPFWTGATIRDRVFDLMTPEWNAAFEAGIFTEFMEQRAPGHAILDDKIYRLGLLDLRDRARAHRESLDYLDDLRAYDKAEELTAMEITAEAVVAFAARYADLADSMAAEERDPARASELRTIAETCRRVPGRAPRTFREALQSYWFVHLCVITELNTWDSYNPGRIDQHLYPFYAREVAEGALDRDGAMELLECFWVKFNNQPAPPKVGITEEQSGTYTDFALINVGGLTIEGEDAVNEISYLVLDVVENMKLIQPSACIQVSAKNPDEFLLRASRVIKTGIGQPSVFNTDVIIEEMLHDGKSREDAICGGPSGCVTVSAFGKESCTLTGYCNWPKILEITLHDGVDPRTGKLVGLRTGDPASFTGIGDVLDAYRRQLEYFIDLKVAGNSAIERLYADRMPAPFMSLIMDDCIARGLDYHDGGARYNPTYIQGVGMGTITDSLAAIEDHVFVKRDVGMTELIRALDADFEGCGDLRLRLKNSSPVYGNGDEPADLLAERVFDIYYRTVNGRRNTKGGRYRVNLLPTTVHIYFGSVLGATPNGRKAGVALSEGISPTQGADGKGPTAVLNSAARINHAKTGGTLLNMKFTPSMLEGEGLVRLKDLIRTYFDMRGHHVQFNVVDADTLREAQANPRDHRDLIVRVAGYSDYFVDIGKELQEEIISRTEQRML